ncbi:MAG TPA: rod shape-determining protein MreC [Rudaea sp.]|jgi:rod shape-determining protein MreC|nr:rod shape-determining protein MreC [Rudaea sp.]
MALANNETAPLFAPGASSTLRLIAYLAIAIVLMVADHRNDYLARVRWGLSTAIEPMYRIAAWPSQIARQVSLAITDREELTERNSQLSEQLLLAQARLNRLSVLRDENQRLQELLDVQRSLGLGVQLAKIIDVDTDPARHRIVINAGARQRVEIGQAVLDARGVMGQVVEVLPNTSTVLLITDPAHALPVTVERTGMRVIAHGSVALDRLELPNVPISADIKVGDKLITSGLGGHFPEGFPVGEIRSISNDASGMFAVADARPSAALDRSGDVLILHQLTDQVGPPAPAPAEGPPASLRNETKP